MSAPHGALRMIELASVRLAQDLGTLVTSVEDGLRAGPADDLPDRARALASRLKLLLAAQTPDAEPLALSRLTVLVGGLPEGVTLDAAALDAAVCFDPMFGRLLLNVVLLGADSLPSGGIVRLAGSDGDLFVQIAGPNAAWPDGTALCVADASAARRAFEEGGASRMAMATVMAHESGIRLSTVFLPSGSGAPPILRLGGA